MFYFHPFLGKIPILTNIFFRWVETTNQNKYTYLLYKCAILQLVHTPTTKTGTPKNAIHNATELHNLFEKNHPVLIIPVENIWKTQAQARQTVYKMYKWVLNQK